MTMSMGEFSDELDNFANLFPSTANQLIRLVALEALQNVVPATPVDTGRARSNWFVNVDTPINETTDETKYNPHLLSEASKLLSPTSSNVIWLTNNLPYIVRLNEGWSGQAPAGFVESSVKAAEKAIGAIAQNITF